MRKHFVDWLCKQAETDPDIVLITADLGYGVLEPFSQKFPNQFFNVGVSEQLMIGMAGGMAKQGKKVYCYSINNFASFRCLEQIRNDVAYPNLDVTIISLGAGLNYDNYGYTHYGIEDINVISALPNIAIWSPANFTEFDDALRFSGPSYIRLGKGIGDRDSNRISKSNKVIVSYSDLIGDILDNPKFNDFDVQSCYLLKSKGLIWPKIIGRYSEYRLIEEHIETKLFTKAVDTTKSSCLLSSIKDNWINQGFSPDKTVMSDRQWVVKQLLGEGNEDS